MTVLEDSRRLLALWHAARRQSRARRAVSIAALAAGVEPAQAAAWPLGVRNAWLLQLVRTLVGPGLELVGRCGSCGESVELVVDVTSLADMTHQTAVLAPSNAHTTATLEHAGTTYHCRALTSADLLAVEGLPAEDVDLALLHRVLGEGPAHREARALPDSAKDEARRAAGALDPWAVLRLEVSCPACGTHAEEPLPIADAAWRAVENAAAALVRDVHILARAYGWTEDDILSLPKWRRDVYAEMTRS